MSSKSAMHFRPFGAAMPVCGRDWFPSTSDAVLVTCKACLRTIARLARERAP